jgi:Ca2+-binding RTX toxin-like protein
MPDYNRVGDNFLVNTRTAGDQGSSTTTWLSSGGFVVCWRDNTGASADIRGQLYDAAGNRAGLEFLVNTTTTGEQFAPDVATLAGGGFVVTWTSVGGDGSGSCIQGQVFSDSGGKVGTEFLVNSTTNLDQYAPTVTGLASGGFVVSWTDGSGDLDAPDDRTVKAQVFSASGAAVGGEILINTYSSADLNEPMTGSRGAFDPTIAALPSGGFVVAWSDLQAEIEVDPRDTYRPFTGINARIYDAGGSPVTGEFLVNTVMYSAQLNPVIATLSSGAFVVIWTDRSGDEGRPDLGDGDLASIKGQIFSGDGDKLGGEFLVNTTGAGYQDLASVTALPTGGFVVSWASSGPNSTDANNVLAQVFDDSGSKVGAEFLVNSQSAGDQTRPDITSLAGGGFAISWSDSTADSSGYGVKAQVFGSVPSEPIEGSADDDTLSGTNGADVINGLAGNDHLDGLAGNDVIDGGSGIDSMTGGAGDDTFFVDDAGDKVFEMSGGGTDTVRSSVSYSLAGQYIENLILTGSASINGSGNSLGNNLSGNGAANVLNGGEGADTMAGGAGADTYFVENAGDKVHEGNVAGIDTVRSSVSFSLSGQYIENLVLTGTAAINGTGNSLANALTGNSAANTLNGGEGADSMTGGAGNDIFIVDNAGDKAFESNVAGVDTVKSSVTYNLAGQYIENLVLTGSGAINGTGNSLANAITGNAAANVLNGGEGADTMIGGAGDDTFYVDNAGDKTIEADGAGIDTVRSSVTFSLAGQYIEKLALTGSAAIDGSGNSLANSLTGNGAANTLNGGEGADTMAGGAGSDTYFVENAGDKVLESNVAGIDTVRSSVSFSLSGQFIENLVLTGSGATTAAGNSLANTLTGNGAVNTLNGGEGNDSLYGMGGNDVLKGSTGLDAFYFTTALSASSNVDKLTDFSVADDTVLLSRTIFTAIGADGTLAASAFAAGTAAADADDRILYDSASGKIFYDADGDGTGAAILFAQVNAGTALTNLDFEAYMPV